MDVQRCRHSNGRPYSRSRAPAGAASEFLCPTEENIVPHERAFIPRHKPHWASNRSLTLKAKCSRKWAVPFVLSVSALLPASMKTPTVAVCTYGECSVAIYPTTQESASYPSSYPHATPEKAAAAAALTVSPFDRVVDCVMVPGFSTFCGAWEASDLVRPGNLLGTSRLPCLRRPEAKAVRATRAAAIGDVNCEWARTRRRRRGYLGLGGGERDQTVQ